MAGLHSTCRKLESRVSLEGTQTAAACNRVQADLQKLTAKTTEALPVIAEKTNPAGATGMKRDQRGGTGEASCLDCQCT